MSAILSPIRSIKKYVSANKKGYLFAGVLASLFLLVGVVLGATGEIEGGVYSSIEISLYEIITDDYSGFALLWSGLVRLLLPLLILFVLNLSRWTYFLGFVYLGYQSLLLGASLSGLIAENGFIGVLNGIVMVLPINILNFFIIISGLIIFSKRLNLATYQKLSLGHSLKIFFPKILALILGSIFSAVVFGFIYPLLLRSIIIVNP